MPAISVDTFFACSLIIVVAVSSMAVAAKIVQPYLKGMDKLNQESYLRGIVENFLLNYGSPVNWGANKNLTPEVFGLAKSGSFVPYELDVDKVCRLNPQNAYAITYLTLLESLKVKDVALRISISQMMNIHVNLMSNTTDNGFTTYSFNVKVERDGLSVEAYLRCYLVAKNYLSGVSTDTSSNGEAAVNVEIPNSSNGTALFIVFARAKVDPKVTCYAVYSFGHLSQQPQPNGSFLKLSPLNYTLYVNKIFDNETLLNAYALTYNYNFSLTLNSNTTYKIPKLLDSSPIVLVVTGTNSSEFFAEWTAYPQVPLEMGANFQHSENAAFTYIVRINNVLYRFEAKCGGPSS